MNIKIIGVGGIGGALLPFLCRYLHYREGPRAQVTLVDGDDFESKNRTRQGFQRVGNKAKVKAEELALEFDGVSFRSTNQFVSPENIGNIIQEGNIVFLGVDNHATRRLVSEHCGKLQNITLISGGNEYTDGNVQLYIRQDGHDITNPLTHFHPEIQEPADRLPNEEGCERLIEESAPQLIFTNLALASAMLAAFYAVGELKAIPYDELYLDLPSGRQVPIKRSID